MPLHLIYHPPTVFSTSDKQTISERITKIYVDVGLPAFYAVVLFVPIESSSFYVGGKPRDNFIRIVVQHLARQIPSSEAKQKFSETYETVYTEFVKDKGYDWEVNISLLLFIIIFV